MMLVLLASKASCRVHLDDDDDDDDYDDCDDDNIRTPVLGIAEVG